MVRQPTEYSKRKEMLQEAYRAGLHLRKSRGMLRAEHSQSNTSMDATNKWSGARKRMKKVEPLRVSFRDEGKFFPAKHSERSGDGKSRRAC
jgi:hypothetical protein